MIDTITTKAAMETQGYYERGSGAEEILILGSCRTIAFLSYLVRWNESIGANRFTIRRIDPCEWMEAGIEPRVARAETDEKTRSILKGCKIFIHEHLENFGMFNTDKNAEKNIYDFALFEDYEHAECLDEVIDIAIPNWHDHLILKNDWVDYGAQTPPDWIERGEAEIEKFCGVCKLSSFPEFGNTFRDTWRKIRYFWRPNHTSAAFTTAIFILMNKKFLNLQWDLNYWGEIGSEDLFRDPHTAVTPEDVTGYNLEWT